MKRPITPAIVVISLIIAGISGLATSIYLHQGSEQPVYDSANQVRTFHNPVSFAKQIEHDPHAGEKIYLSFCASCHAPQPLIQLKAPRVGVKKDWQAWQRVDIDELTKIAAKGVNAMPARGGCFECSNKQLKQAIQYMLEQSR